jgi:hypothetical protein
MLELLFGPLLMNWGPPILAYVQQNPWRVLSVILVAVLSIGWSTTGRLAVAMAGWTLAAGAGTAAEIETSAICLSCPH